MQFDFSVKTVFFLLSTFMKVLAIWPISDNSSKYWIYSYRALWCFYLINHVMITAATIHTFIVNSDNTSIATYFCMEVTTMIECIVILINFIVHEQQIKVLMTSVKNLLASDEALIPLDNKNVYIINSVSVTIMYVIATYLYMHESKSLDKAIIMMAQYTFTIESVLLKTILYCHQLIFLMYTASIVIMDGIVVILMYVCSARLKILENKLKFSLKYKHLTGLIRDHQDILELIRETNKIVRVIVMKTVISFIIFCVNAGIQVVSRDIYTIRTLSQFSIIGIVYLRLSMCAESADNLATHNDSVEFAIYSTSWYEEDLKYVTTKIIMINRCQIPPRIHVNGLMEAFNRTYLITIFYVTFSYFMTIRTLINK